MSSEYEFGGGDPRPDVLSAGDYPFVVTWVEEGGPYQKEDGGWVLPIRIKINNTRIKDWIWSGIDKNGEKRDKIGEFLLAIGRAPAKGQPVDWSRIVGAKGKCRTFVDEEFNTAKVKFYFRPKAEDLKAENRMTFPKSAAAATPPAKGQTTTTDDEPDDVPF